MKSFSFQLETVLTWRRSQLDVALRRQAELRANLFKIETDMQHCRRAMNLQVLPVMSGLELAAFQFHLVKLQGTLTHLEKIWRTTRESLKSQTSEVLAANRQVKILELLREKKWVEWNQSLDRELESLAADITSNRWVAANELGRGTPTSD